MRYKFTVELCNPEPPTFDYRVRALVDDCSDYGPPNSYCREFSISDREFLSKDMVQRLMEDIGYDLARFIEEENKRRDDYRNPIRAFAEAAHEARKRNR